MSKNPTAYTSASIKVLKGLEPVKQRPGMYTRTEDPLHIVQEVLDNSVDEALAKYATAVTVTMHADGSVSVEDDGRGIPVDMHPEEKVSTVEVVFTRLHAGGKFDKGSGGAYTFSGGLHGVGVSVTNALSRRLEVDVTRDGGRWRIVFADGGDVVEKLTRVGDAPARAHGTRVRVYPDPKYFESPVLPLAQLERLLKAKAVLLPGVKVTLRQEKAGTEQTWQYEQGLHAYLVEALAGQELLVPVLTGEKYAGPASEESSFAEGEGCAWALSWTTEGPLFRESYVNLVPTIAGGTHDAGLKEGVFKAVSAFIEHHGLLPKGVKLLPEDVFSRASYVLSAKVLDPQFQGQTKDKLNSRDALRLVASMVKDPFELWLNEHPEAGRRLAELAIRQAQSRMRSAQKVEKRKQSGVAVLPGKLTDCEMDDASRTELFLVEGDSAGGSAKAGRKKEFQAVLPLRGKVLNTWEIAAGQLFANKEIHDIAVAIGVDPHTADAGAEVLANLRYGKVIILSDADVDGAHIQTLLLACFCRHFPKLVENGHIFIAQPPLFRVDVPARGKAPAKKIYCLDEREKEQVIAKCEKEGVRREALSISRFKGLGEMSAEQLWETTLNPDTRRLVRVEFGQDGQAGEVATFDLLMGKSEAASRRAWMEKHGNEVEADV